MRNVLRWMRMSPWMAASFITRLRVEDRGATAVEYGVMVALIAAVIIGTVYILGGQVNTAFQQVVDGLDPVIP